MNENPLVGSTNTKVLLSNEAVSKFVVFTENPLKDEIVTALNTSDDYTKCMVLSRIGSMGESGAASIGYVKDVASFLDYDEPQVVAAAVSAIGQMGVIGATVQDNIVPLIHSDELQVQCAAIDALGTLAPSTAEKEADVAPFLKDSSATVRAAACRCLGLMQAWSNDTELEPCLSDPDSDVVIAALGAVGKWGEDGSKLVPAVAGCLNSTSPAVREEATRTLGGLGESGEKYADKVAELLMADDNMVRAGAVRYFELLGIGARKGAEKAAAGLKHQSGRVQAACALALGNMKAEKYVEDVAALMTTDYDSDVSVALAAAGVEPTLPAAMRRPACAAALALALMGGDGHSRAAEVAKCVVEDMPPESTACFIQALGMMAATFWVDKAIEFSQDPAAPVRAASCYLLDECGKCAGNRRIAEALAARLKDPYPDVRQSAVTALGHLPAHGPPFLEQMVKLFGDKVAAVQCASIKAVASIGEMGAMYAPDIARMLSDVNAPSVRVIAVEALGDMGERGAAFAEEAALLLDDAEGALREAALKALAKMGEDAKPFLDQISRCKEDTLPYVRAAAEECEAALA